MSSSVTALGAAAVFLILCLASFWWAALPSSVGRRQVSLVFTWLCASLATTLVIFSLFPTSAASGSVMGITLGGAGAFVILVWTAAIRAGRSAERIDRLDSQVRQLKRQLEGVTTAARPRRLEFTQTFYYDLKFPSSPRSPRRLGVVTGDIRLTRCAEVWVNSENTEMSMSRVQDHSISALIRYEGSRHDETGHVLEDLVADELDRLVAGHRPVPAGTVVITGAGQLEHSGVKWIAHVAAVQGEPGSGFSQVRRLDRCVVNVLRTVGGPEGKHASSTLLFPLLGAGQGGGDMRQTVKTLATVVLSYLAATPTTTLDTIFLLAYTDAELEVCREVLSTIPGLTASREVPDRR